MPSTLYADVYVNTPVDKSFLYRIPSDLKVEPGQRVNVNFAGRITVGYVTAVHGNKTGDFEVKDIISVIDSEPIFDNRLVELIHYVSFCYVASRGESLAKALPSAKKTRDVPFLRKSFTHNFNHSLSDEQNGIYEDIKKSCESVHLIHGITGSGKTEVYIKLAIDVISAGKSVIFMVPEIGLSSQIYARLRNVFEDNLIIYHSLLNVNERYESWVRFYRGDARIVIGTRSAVFMQCPSLGLIIIDEEQDGSYKEQSTPRYSAKRLAYFRARGEGAKLILGSATPSVESYYAAEKKTIRLHSITKRYGSSVLPEIEIVQISGKNDEVSSRLKLFTNRAVSSGKQAVFLLNRRGFSPVVLCSECKEVVSCPNCNIGMNYHKNRGLLCHYCGHTAPVPKVCGHCGSESIEFIGAGTQKIEEIVSGEFPSFRIFRMDQDNAKRKNSASDLVKRMEAGEIDILLGTQMISKGFDFPNVEIAGVLMADIGLNLPDFRSSEKIFSLLVQLAGRSGRGGEKGRVIIQTLNPDHGIYRYVVSQDYLAFYKNELEMRRALCYPPFARLVRLVVRGRDEQAVENAADKLSENIAKAVKQAGVLVDVLGPSPAPLSKVGNNYRYHIILKCGTQVNISGLLRHVLQKAEKKNVYVEVDVDPVDMI